MKLTIPTHIGLAAFALANITLVSDSDAAIFAAEVIDYTPGAGASATNPSAALGEPNPIVGEGSAFAGSLTPFNPHFEDDEIVQLGEGGQLTLRFPNYANTGGGFPQIGIFANVGFIDTDFPNGFVGEPVGAFGVDSISVEFSEDGNQWFAPSSVLLDQPSAYFTDTASLSPADYGQSQTNAQTDFAGLDFAGVLALLDGSAGGTWIDIGSVPVSQIGYIRFSVSDDGDASTTLTAEIDGVSIENRAVGDAIPEPSAIILALVSSVAMLLQRRRNR